MLMTVHSHAGNRLRLQSNLVSGKAGLAVGQDGTAHNDGRKLPEKVFDCSRNTGGINVLDTFPVVVENLFLELLGGEDLVWTFKQQNQTGDCTDCLRHRQRCCRSVDTKAADAANAEDEDISQNDIADVDQHRNHHRGLGVAVSLKCRGHQRHDGNKRQTHYCQSHITGADGQQFAAVSQDA